MKQTKVIEPNKFYHLYRSLSVESRLKFSEKIKRQDKYISRYNIKIEDFEYLNELLKLENPNTIGESVEFDYWQVQKYFQGLTQLINTPEDFQILIQKKKDAIIQEHRTIHKQLLNYKSNENGN
jgi:hypothetical protein